VRVAVGRRRLLFQRRSPWRPHGRRGLLRCRPAAVTSICMCGGTRPPTILPEVACELGCRSPRVIAQSVASRVRRTMGAAHRALASSDAAVTRLTKFKH
jgi:hypothetical protein